MRFQSADACLEALNSSANVRRLVQVCIDSAQHQLNILSCLHEQSLLGEYLYRLSKDYTDKSIDSFLPFDLESTIVSSVVLLLAPAIDSSLLESRRPWLHKSYMILDDMISRGNLIAQLRKSELEQLSNLLYQLTPDRILPEDQRKLHPVELSSPLAPAYRVPDLPSLNDGLTTAEIMAVAESIDTGDVDWVAHAVTENQIW